ncbi:hypothetical protein NQ318_011754 [Aromia moschata]|uniref:Regucalcin n=1 Tax=Aromia moschata TaxID=1265417 RepID=A0AAV8XZE3_9CUCU|nr:hypothetical protein NQ318_011754 [Aromia moschata]
MAPVVEKVVECGDLGEGPHWDAETQTLYFVDIVGHNIHKYVPSTREHTKAYIGKNVSIIIPVKDKSDEFVITIGREIVRIKWDGESETVTILEKLYEVEPDTPHVFNDGKCDPSGRLWAGTLGVASVKDDQFPDEQCNLYSFYNKQVITQLSKIGLSNGIAFNTDRKKMYYVDSLKGTLDEFDFDIKNGTISNGKPIYTLNAKRGIVDGKVLDGMTIDTEGNLWVAVFNEARILKIDPRKPETIAGFVELPAKQVTSVTFGGPNLDELYVTTGRLAVQGVKPSSPDDGVTYRVTGVNAKGFPGVRIVL